MKPIPQSRVAVHALPAAMLHTLFGIVLAFSASLACVLYQMRSVEYPTHHRFSEKAGQVRANPWRGLPGCAYADSDVASTGSTGSTGSDTGKPYFWSFGTAYGVLCNLSAPDLALQLPGQPEVIADALLQVTKGPDRSDNGKPREVIARGADVSLGLKPLAQARMQAIADCATGDKDACAKVGIPSSRWQHHFESSAVRAIGAIQMDIQTGVIEAIASAHTTCFAQAAKHQELDADCPATPQSTKPEPWRLENHAIRTMAQIGSTNKIAIVLALLRGNGGAQYLIGAQRQALLDIIKTSGSRALFKHLYDQNSNMQRVKDAAWDLHFNQPDFSAMAHEFTSLMQPSARFFSDQGVFPTIPSIAIAQCAAQDWEKCSHHAGLARVQSELWGAGSTLSSPLGLLPMLSALGNASNGMPLYPMPSILKRSDGKGPYYYRHHIQQTHAQLITEGMSRAHLAAQRTGPPGTVHSACMAVYGSVAACAQLGIASKSGTPGFAHKAWSTGKRALHCNRIKTQLADNDNPSQTLRTEDVYCKQRPWKWSIHLLKGDGSGKVSAGPWAKAIVVLSERNFVRHTGVVDSPLDTGTPNISAELAFWYLKSQANSPSNPS